MKKWVITHKKSVAVVILAIVLAVAAALYFYFWTPNSSQAPVLNTYNDAAHKFSVVLPQDWVGKISPVGPFGNTTSFVYTENCGGSSAKPVNPPVFLLSVMPKSQWSPQVSQGYTLAVTNGDTAYAYKVSGPSLCSGKNSQEFSLFIGQVPEVMKSIQFR